MTYLAKDLKHRIDIKKSVHVESGSGFSQSYETLTTCWAQVKPAQTYLPFVQARGGANISDSDTHIMLIRFSSIKNLGKAFDSAFGLGFDVIEDIEPLKRDYFVFERNGTSVKGRLFKINAIQRDEKNREYMRIKATEIEEQGTGHTA